MSDLIVPVTLMNKKSREAQSTEEVLRAVEEASVKLREERVQELVIGSMDVRALYPSLDIEASARIVSEEIIKSEIEYRGVDIKLAGVYLATALSKERQSREGIASLLPRKKSEGKHTSRK